MQQEIDREVRPNLGNMVGPREQRAAEQDAGSLDSNSERDLIPCDPEDARIAQNSEEGLPGWYFLGTLKKFDQHDQRPIDVGTGVRDDKPIDAQDLEELDREEDDEQRAHEERAHELFLHRMDERQIPFEAPIHSLGLSKKCNESKLMEKRTD